jgi:hypothetical protein
VNLFTFLDELEKFQAKAAIYSSTGQYFVNQPVDYYPQPVGKFP